MRKSLSTLVSILALFLLFPTGMILASWNAIPGDLLYGTKIALENAASGATGDTRINRELQVNLAERRFQEADKLLTEQNSTIGYATLIEQTTLAKDKIIEAQDTSSKEKLKSEVIVFQQKLEERKVQISTGEITVKTATPTPIKKAATQNQPKAQPTPTTTQNPPPPPPTTNKEIEDTQKKLDEILKDLNQQVITPKEKPQDQKEENKKNNDNKGQMQVDPKQQDGGNQDGKKKD